MEWMKMLQKKLSNCVQLEIFKTRWSELGLMGGQEKDGGGLGKGGGGWRDREEGREGGMQQVEEVEQATAWEEEEVEQVEEEGQCNCMGGVGSVHCTGYLLLPSSLGYNAFGKVARSNVIGVFAIQLYNNTYRSISLNITSHTS